MIICKFKKGNNCAVVMFVFLVCLLSILLFCDLAKADFTWDIQDVDAGSEPGSNALHISLDVDSRSYPHISYFDQKKNISIGYCLNYAHWNGGNWDIEIVDSNGDVGSHCSLALDSQNYPHISYYNGTKLYGLMYAYWDGKTSEWITQKIDPGHKVGLETSICIDSNDNPRISFFDHFYGNQSLRYAYWDGNNSYPFFFKTVDTDGNVGYESSIALDSNDIPHISYHDAINNNLKYVYLLENKWIIQTIDNSGGDVARKSSLVLDSNDNPHISYTIFNEGKNLMYIFWTGDVWNIQKISSGAESSLALNANDSPCIAYYDNGLKYATVIMSISSPNGGEIWYKGEIYTISWNSENVGDYVQIELYKGNTYVSTIDLNASNNGSYNWKIPEGIETDEYTIKITSKSDTNKFASTLVVIKGKELITDFPITLVIILCIALLAIIIFIAFRRFKS